MSCIKISIKNVEISPDINTLDISDRLKIEVENKNLNSDINLSELSNRIIATIEKIEEKFNIKISDKSDRLKVYCSLICDASEIPFIEILIEDIELDCYGTPVIVEVKSNTDWTIE